MKKTTKYLILQGIGVGLQMINAQVAILTAVMTKDEIKAQAIALIIGAIIASYQFVIQHLGNQTQPGGMPGDAKKEAV